jgi:ribose 5-phosphate isomerase B
MIFFVPSDWIAIPGSMPRQPSSSTSIKAIMARARMALWALRHESRQSSVRNLHLRIAIASDHAAFALKAELPQRLPNGARRARSRPDSDARVDYPDFGYKLAEVVASGAAERGVAVRFGHRHLDRGQPQSGLPLRAGFRPYSATLSRQHNNANVIAMGAR